MVNHCFSVPKSIFEMAQSFVQRSTKYYSFVTAYDILNHYKRIRRMQPSFHLGMGVFSVTLLQPVYKIITKNYILDVLLGN